MWASNWRRGSGAGNGFVSCLEREVGKWNYFETTNKIGHTVRDQAALRCRDGDRNIDDNTIAIGLPRVAIEAGRLIDRKDERVMLQA